ncbi:glutathione S-transferase [Hymenopellis radicata]|nr:glutathione S-transferase [Hymenopellis radicata]
MASESRDVSSQTDISKMKTSDDGSFKRAPMTFRNVIEKGGKFEPELDRYHLYVSYACPWATRTLIVRKLKGLDSLIRGRDPNYNAQHVKDLYLKADPNFSGRFTVPILWDKKLHTVVNNESSEIIRIFNTAFNDSILRTRPDLRAEIDSLNDWIYPNINNGVYRSGFATTQSAYEEAVHQLFESLDKVEKLLTGKQYIVGDRLTECDIRLWVTIIRFDPVYVGHFKCNIRDIRHGYPVINKWMKNLYWNNDAFKSSTNFKHIKTHYYWSHQMINGTRIVPVGPIPDIEPL